MLAGVVEGSTFGSLSALVPVHHLKAAHRHETTDIMISSSFEGLNGCFYSF